MTKSVKAHLSMRDQSHLRCLVRLSCEFYCELRIKDTANKQTIQGIDRMLRMRGFGKSKLNPPAMGVDVLSGMDSFEYLFSFSKMLTKKSIRYFTFQSFSPNALKKMCLLMFKKFLTKKKFDEKLNLLLCLFRIMAIYNLFFYEKIDEISRMRGTKIA